MSIPDAYAVAIFGIGLVLFFLRYLPRKEL
jgi:hypothetical protein